MKTTITRTLVLIAIVATLAAGMSAVNAQSGRSSVGARRGPIARLIELERRKNEWLRERFGR